MKPGARTAAGKPTARRLPPRDASRRSSAPRRQLLRIAGELVADHRQLTRRRTTVVLGLLLVALAALAARLVQVQLVMADRLRQMAQRQQIATLAIEPHRGRILDRNGRPLAVNVEVTSIYGVPTLIDDRHAFAVRVAPAVGESTAEIERRLQGGGKYFAWVARKVAPQVAARVKALGLGDSIGFLTEDRRAYPNGSLGAHVLGFVGIDNQGLGGAELAYDATLRGRAGSAVAERDGVGRVLIETQRTIEAPQNGSDLVLTIDQVIQHIAERELERAVMQTHARRGLVLVMDPKTGEVLALAGRPLFDPNAGSRARPEQWLNRAVAVTYEPGSTFKIFLTAAALNSRAVTPEERFFCNGSLQVSNHVIRDAHGPHGWQTMSDMVTNSCNVAAAQVATRLGKEAFYRYIRAFGFGRATGIDLPGEVQGLVPPPAEWRGPGLQTIGFGQGVGTTALQILVASTALVNDGGMVRPHIVRAVRDPQGRVVRAMDVGRLAPVITAQTAHAVLRMMTRVVEEGTGTQAAIAGYPVAGKTGTAQKPSPAGGYDPNRFVASFLGIVPTTAPRLAILVVLDEPEGAYYGGAVAAPVFREVASQALWYLRVPPATGALGGPGK
ncbi:MAG TPA: penicillin-binding protein 2 [bacterium]|jgi:cell division protein FtsI/penicillin-binding protein 2